MTHSTQDDRYPTTDTLRCDPRMARLLFRAYYDELNTVSAYQYYGLMLTEHNPALAALFESISMTEMRHFRLLGKTVCRLGGNPIIRTELRVPSAELCRGTSKEAAEAAACKLLHSALAAEQSAAWEYRTLAQKTGDSALKKILCRLAAEEEEHAQMLRELGKT